MDTYQVAIEGTDVRVACAADQSILDAFLSDGTWLANSCNQGSCGTCKVQLQVGDVDHRATPETTLPADERRAGWALACQAAPCSDLVLHRPATGQPTRRVPRLHVFTAVVHTVEDIAADTRRLVLRSDDDVEFAAGQHVEITVPGTDQSRLYSFANAPDGGRDLEFHVKREPGGLASERWVFSSVEAGQRVRLRGPLGDFLWSDDDGGPVVMIAGGTGLAPMLSILRVVLPSAPTRPVTLYHGVRTGAHLYDVDVLDALAATYEGFRWRPCADDDPTGTKTAVDTFLDEHPSCRGYSGYLCGPPPMVEAGVRAFKRRRMAPSRIRRERFLPDLHTATAVAGRQGAR